MPQRCFEPFLDATENSDNGPEASDGYYMPLTPWQKLAIMVAGFAIVSVTVVIVACTIFPGGCLFPLFCRDDGDCYSLYWLQ